MDGAPFASARQLQLNAFEPVIAHSLLESTAHVTIACRTPAHRCVPGITANTEHLRRAVEHSIGVVTALNPHIGHTAATGYHAGAHAAWGREALFRSGGSGRDTASLTAKGLRMPV